MNSTFPRVRRTQVGYDIEQVEDFLEEARRVYAADVLKVTGIDAQTIRRVSFEMVRGGYSTEHVDSALDRLEDAFARRERERAIADVGEEAFFGSIQEQASAVLKAISRPDGERFPRQGALTRGYRVEEVDRLIVRIIDYLDDGPELSPSELRLQRFTSQRGGYSEDAVDELIDQVITLIHAVH